MPPKVEPTPKPAVRLKILESRMPAALVAGIALVFLMLPILVLVARAVLTQAWEGLPGAGVVEAVSLSFATTLVTSALTLLFGTPLAYALARWHFPFKRLAQVLVELPIVLPPAVAGLALLLAFGRRGALGPLLDSFGIALPFTTAAVVMAQGFVSAPFFIRAAQLGFKGVPQEIEDAARVDGAGGLALFRYVTLPLSSRALAAGLVLSWARALGEFGATILFAGSLQGRTQTMPLLIYNVLERDINAAIWTGVLLVGLALAALLLSHWLTSKSDEASL
jgi:molybdate transport system permease protein